MRIKLIERGVAEVVLSRFELSACGVESEGVSPKSSQGRQLLYWIFDALEGLCGLSRGGNFTFVECRPYINGGCRLSVGYTDQPSGRLYAFDCVDDMLDAMNNMQCIHHNEYFNTENMDIYQIGDKFFMFFSQVPQEGKLSQHDLAILNEYTASI